MSGQDEDTYSAPWVGPVTGNHHDGRIFRTASGPNDVAGLHLLRTGELTPHLIPDRLVKSSRPKQQSELRTIEARLVV